MFIKLAYITYYEPSKVPNELKPLFDYIENRPVADDDELMGKIDADVIKYSGSEWRSKFMTFDEIRKWEREEGREEGRQEGREEGTLKILIRLIKDGTLTPSEAAQKSGIKESVILEYM